jgi:hypothetical protein
VTHPALEGCALAFVHAGVACQRGGVDLARKLVDESLQELPGHRHLVALRETARRCSRGWSDASVLDDLYAGHMSRFMRERSATLGPSARPVAIPDDVDDPRVVKAHGVVELPLRVRWSGPVRRYDLDDRNDRASVYEQVLTEGTDEDVRFYVVVDDLVDMWSELVLPRHVRRAWAGWLAVHRGVDLAC